MRLVGQEIAVDKSRHALAKCGRGRCARRLHGASADKATLSFAHIPNSMAHCQHEGAEGRGRRRGRTNGARGRGSTHELTSELWRTSKYSGLRLGAFCTWQLTPKAGNRKRWQSSRPTIPTKSGPHLRSPESCEKLAHPPANVFAGLGTAAAAIATAARGALAAALIETTDNTTKLCVAVL